MDNYVIKLKCYNVEKCGFFTGIIKTTTGFEIGVHPYRNRAKVFNNIAEANRVARYLKNNFRCVSQYEVIEI